ncbi:protein of unknown function [Halogranum gelatinilyticum]|uniref:DUF4870 domain-containing protein n=1 Tax=Halogranum gelatinilyticum TaxID=660521 RepID=A0A1G9XNE8_9EURY|nr:DUF4870 domain-containing protein [Halogranum gelatinilyticum]SDM98284.1 protein of unknown function [Halogranum gelatinilyticum]
MPSTNVRDEEDRTATGVIVHAIGFVFGVFGTALVFFLSRRRFSTSNARNALNWQLFVLFALFLLTFCFTVSPWDLVSIVPGFAIFGLLFLDVLCCGWATVQALRGNAWSYPFARKFV